jgi:tetratricopeptide (TPR) repeat protein
MARVDDRLAEACRLYKLAPDALPPSAARSTLATEILIALGEISYLEGDHDGAFNFFSEAVACKGGLGLSHIHLRLGQLRAERGELDRARELLRAYIGSGMAHFENEDPKYFALIKDTVEKGRA